MPKVSVVVPVYNSEKYLNRCLDSLVNQTIDSMEIIVVNDGSTDDSQKIIEKYMEKNPNIRVFKKENGGLSDARNFGISQVSGEYIGFVDADDYVEKEMYANMYNEAKINDLDIIECNFIWEYPDKLKYDNGKEYLNISDYYVFGRVMACNKLFKTSILKENKMQFPLHLQYEDIEFFYKLTPFIKKTGLIKDYYYHYVQRENSIINSQNIKNKDLIIVLNNIASFYKEKNIFQNYKTELEYLYIRLLLGSGFLRIIKIKDKKIKKYLLENFYEELSNKFPNWRKNKLLKIKMKKNLYYRTVNKITLKIYAAILKNHKKEKNIGKHK